MITTHVLDISVGKPAGGVRVSLARVDDAKRVSVGSGVTDAEGRLRDLAPNATALDAGVYELTFETGTYFRTRGVESFHPWITVAIQITNTGQHYHVPLLVSPYGFTTYRGA